MAPSRSRSGATIQRWVGEGSQLLRRSAVYRRQNRGGDNQDNDGRRRFRFGNNNGDGDRDDNENDGDGRGGNFFRSGNGNGNGNGNGGGSRFGNGDANNDGGRDRDGNGSRFGSGNGNNNGDGNRDGNGSRFGDGFGNRFGDGFGRDRNDNNGDDSTRSIPSSSAESPSPSTSSPSASPEPTSTELAASSAVAASSTTEAPSTFNPGVILLQSAVTGSPTVEANPTVTAFIPLMTPGDVGGPANLSGSGGGETPDASSAAEPSVYPTPFPSAPPTGGPMDNENDGGDGAVNRLEVSRAGMDPTAERILISVGSIGGFILACFVIWMVWRSMRKSRKNGSSHGRLDGLRRGAGFRIPFFRRRSWETLDDTLDTRSPPPSYREKMGSAHGPSVEGFFKPDTVQQQQLPPQSWPQSLSDVAVGPGQDPRQSNMYQPPVDPRHTYNAANRPHITLVTNIPPYLHQPQQSFSSTSAAHFSSPMTEHNTPSPLQNGVSPASYYSQPLLAQQFTAPYNPIYRQPSHAISEVSSLSSGFGDVDGIYITESIVAPPAPTATPGSASNSPQQYTARFSWMSHPREPAAADPPSRQNSGASRGGRRETVYTQSSEDRPARFRSVRSWVNQQTGRIKRAQQRGPDQASPIVQVLGNPGIPGIHNPPREQDLGMMMDDEEKPRRVDEVVGLGKMG